MGNRLKMGKRQVMYQLFAQGWSNRKIHEGTGIHRDTITRYRRIRQQEYRVNSAGERPTGKDARDPEEPAVDCSKCSGKVITGEVAHFELITPGLF